MVGKHNSVVWDGKLDKVICIDQSPIGRTPRSNPATYTGLFSDIRDLFAQTKDAKAKGFKPAPKAPANRKPAPKKPKTTE